MVAEASEGPLGLDSQLQGPRSGENFLKILLELTDVLHGIHRLDSQTL